MKITITNIGGKPLHLALDVSPQDTIASIKAHVEEADGVLHYQQKLLWNGKQFQDLDASLGSYGMRDDGDGKVHKVRLLRTYPPEEWVPFKLEIRTADEVFSIDIRPVDTVRTIKETVQRAKGWKAAEQETLLLDDDTTTVSENGLDAFSSVLLGAREGTELYRELGGVLYEESGGDAQVVREDARRAVRGAVGGEWPVFGGVEEGEGEGGGDGVGEGDGDREEGEEEGEVKRGWEERGERPVFGGVEDSGGDEDGGGEERSKGGIGRGSGEVEGASETGDGSKKKKK